MPTYLRRLTSALLIAWTMLGLRPAHAQTPTAGAPEKTRIQISVGGKAGFYYLPLTIAEQLGYFKDEGLDVQISDFAGGSKALEAMIGGSADVVSGAYEHTIDMQVKGQPVRAFVLMGRAPQISIGVASAHAAAFHGARDLKGMKVGVSAPGSSTNIALDYFIGQAGMKPGDISVIGVGTSAGALAALNSGQIDAISNVDPVMTMLEQRGEVKIVADARTLKGTEQLFGGPMPAACLYAPQDFVTKYPRTVQALTNAIVRADPGLGGFSARYPHELSGGMRKRVSLAQTLAVDPDIILMDEPFAALDIQTRQLMENEVLALWEAKKKAVLFITHDLDEAIALSDRVVVLSAGPATRPIGAFDVGLDRPRDVAAIRALPEFARLHAEIWAAMKDEVLRGYARQMQVAP